ncbi:MAG: hypothetical protein IPJ47_15295 [Anaerolineales bacterium]|jgi:hypothetical protein|nr:hypothetical protein [Anaerolineales bacterium]
MITFQDILDYGLPLVFVYFVLSLISSTLSQILMDTFEVRGKTLERFLILIAGENADDLLNLPQIRALQPIKFKSWFSIFGAQTEPKKLENIPISVLVDAFFSLMGLGNTKKKQGVREIKTAIRKMPESGGKQALLNWLAQGISNLEDLRLNTQVYFSGLLEQSVATANARSRSFVISFAVFMVIFFNVDSIQIVEDLIYGPQLRALVAAQAEAIVQQDSTDIVEINDMLETLDDLDYIRFGWFSLTLPRTNSILDWAGFIASKIVGLTITAVFASQGSTFWFDLLAKFK